MYEAIARIGGFIGFWGSFNILIRKCHSKAWQRSMKRYFPKNRQAAREFRKKKRQLKAEGGFWSQVFSCCKNNNKSGGENMDFLEKHAFMDSKEFHRLFSFQ